jgi:hypothetical protein
MPLKSTAQELSNIIIIKYLYKTLYDHDSSVASDTASSFAES